MAKPKALTVKRIEKLLRRLPGKYTDGDMKGLMLVVESKTSAYWLLRWQRNHKTRHMGLGSALEGSSRYLSLAAAREKAREQHERIARDIDPLELKRADRAAQRQAEARQHTFREAAEPAMRHWSRAGPARITATNSSGRWSDTPSRSSVISTSPASTSMRCCGCWSRSSEPDQGRGRRYALASAHGDGRPACGAGSSG